MTQYFSHYARQSPNHLALVAPDGRHWSRGELQAECVRLAAGLRQLGLAPGDRVALVLPNCAEFLALALSLMSIGCEVKAWDAESSTVSYADFLRGKTPRLLIGHERLAEIAAGLKSAMGFANRQSFAVGVIEGFGRYDDLLLDAAEGQDDDIIGNTTLAPTLLDIEPEQDNIHYCGLSLADQEARTWAIDSLHYGHAVILTDKWNPQSMLHDIDRYRVTTSYMMPGQFTRLLELSQEICASYDTASIEHVICPVNLCPQPLKKAMMQWWEISIYEYSETNYLDSMGTPSLHEAGQANYSTLN